MSPIIESVVLELAAGRSEAEFLAACAESDTFLRQQPGFLLRRVVRLDQGRFMDLVEWRSQAEADAAMKASMSEPRVAKLMQALNPHSLVVAHYPVVSAA